MTTTMNRYRPGIRPIGIMAAALFIAAGTYAATLFPSSSSGRTAAAPTGGPTLVQEAVDNAVGAGTGLSVADIDASIRTWSAKAAADKHDYISASNLGILYLGRARLTSNLDDYSRALAATDQALEAFPGYTPARALDATLAFATHDFERALAAARLLLADAPGDADALAVVGDASLELGRIDDARSAYATLATLVPGPALDVRLARLAYLTGDPDRALSIARDARDAALDAGPVDMAFFEYQLGEFARLSGDAATARKAFDAALAIRPAHLGALVGLARVDAAAGDADAAIARLERAVAIAPQPEALALLGDLLDGSGDDAGAGRKFDTVRLTAQLSDLAGAVFDRQLIAFELDHGGASSTILEAARASSAARPDAVGHDLVAWALHRLGRDAEAAAEIGRAHATGIVDARITFHAGAIAIARGDRATGEAMVREALALGPALDPVERAEAERLLAAAR